MPQLLVSHMRIRCPWHHDSSFDCVVSFQYEMVYCMSCGLTGSVEDVIKETTPPTSRVLTEIRDKWREDERQQHALMHRHLRAVVRHNKGTT